MENSVCVVGGHYEVEMLWKSDWLPNNKQKTEARLQSLKKKKNSSVMRAFTERIESLWRTSYRKDTPER